MRTEVGIENTIKSPDDAEPAQDMILLWRTNTNLLCQADSDTRYITGGKVNGMPRMAEILQATWECADDWF